MEEIGNSMYNYSVLMSVYFKEKPEYLRASMESMFLQTLQTNDFVLVCDGELTNELENVITEMKKYYGAILNVVRLPQNAGLGRALNEGIKHCRNELIARMDSDDIAFPDRCERQIGCFIEDDELSMVSGTVEEFSDDINKVEAKRVVPENHNEIMQFAKWRNPFNHPCIMYKKSAVLASGSYQDFYLLEDYYLWIRMLLKGHKGYNIQEPILHMRAGNDMYKRRAGLAYAKSQIKLFKFMKDKQFIKLHEFAKSVIVRSLSAILPNNLRKAAFKSILRH